MLLTPGACNTGDGTAAREHLLCHLGRRHPDANVFRRLEQRLRQTEGVTRMKLVNAGRPRYVWSPAREDPQIEAVE
jgi:hypothetical protein